MPLLRPRSPSAAGYRLPGGSAFATSVLTAALVITLASAAFAATTTTRVSVSRTGAQGNGLSGNAERNQVISGNGRYVAFFTEASNLVPGDTNNQWEVLIRDIQTGRVTRPAVSSAEVQGNNFSSEPALNRDGRYVAYESWATNLVPGDTNGRQDVFVRDMVAGTTSRVSVGNGRKQGNGLSFEPSVNASGGLVAFTSTATNLVPVGTPTADAQVFVRDRTTATTALVSMSTAGVAGNGVSRRASMSANGRYVAFQSEATNLVAEDTNAHCTLEGGCTDDVFVRDLVARTTTRVSLRADGTQSPSGGSAPSISADGRYVAFTGNHLTPDDSTRSDDVYVRDRLAGTTTMVSRSSAGAAGNDLSAHPEISESGRVVTFDSMANNLVAADSNNAEDVFVRDLAASTTVLASRRTGGAQGNNDSGDPDISADGSRVVFNSFASNLVPHDTNGVYDVFFVKLSQ